MDLVVLKIPANNFNLFYKEDDQGKSAEYGITYKAFCLFKNLINQIMKKKLIFILAACTCFCLLGACDEDTAPVVESPVNKGALIIYTSNGGLNWQKNVLPGYDVITAVAVLTPQIEQVSVLANQYGRTQNILRSGYYGGNCISTFTPVHLLNDLVMTNGYGKCIAVGNGLMAMTTDNGHTWVSQTEESDWLTADFYDEMHGIILPAVQGDSNAVTTDGGITWKHRTPVYSGAFFEDVIMLDSVTAIACGSNGSLYRSTDLSISWETVPNPASSTLKCIGFSGDVGIIGTNDNTMLRTTDMGLTWVIVNPGLSHVNEVFLNASAYWAVGSYYVAKSTDQGQTWQVVYTKSDEYFYDMYFSKDEGYVVGQIYVKQILRGEVN
jgi:photosystem II stability/assembly factor-like uncharacterized protein